MGYLENKWSGSGERKEKKARMKVGRGGLSLYNLDPKQDSARRMTTGSVTKMFIGL